MNNQWIITAVLVVVVGGGGFFAGMKYQQSKQSTFTRQLGNGQMLRSGNGQAQVNGTNRMMGFRPVAGEIISADDNSITVKLQDGSSKIVVLSEKTSINKASEATKEELKTGEQVAVFGTENADGSVTAQNIQLNP
jgi:hypothetical protein